MQAILSQQRTLNHTGVVAPVGLKVVAAVLAPLPVHPLAEVVAAGAHHVSVPRVPVMERRHQELLLLPAITAPGVGGLLNKQELELLKIFTKFPYF